MQCLVKQYAYFLYITGHFPNRDTGAQFGLSIRRSLTMQLFTRRTYIAEESSSVTLEMLDRARDAVAVDRGDFLSML